MGRLFTKETSQKTCLLQNYCFRDKSKGSSLSGVLPILLSPSCIPKFLLIIYKYLGWKLCVNFKLLRIGSCDLRNFLHMKRMYKLASMAVLGLLVNTQNINAQMVSDFESIPLSPESFWNGSDLSGYNNTTEYSTLFTSGDAGFLNTWDITWGLPGYWSDGFAQSTYTDSVTSGSGNLYSAKAASGRLGSLTYGVGQNFAGLSFANSAADTTVDGIYLTNTTYAANSMRDGDSFAKKFGGTTGNDPDWFMITIRGFDVNGNILPDTVNYYLADFRDANNSNDYIVTDWQFVDLSTLGNVHGLVFNLSSSDMGGFGMNTPAFFCIDDIKSDGAALIDFEDLGFTSTDSSWAGEDLTGTPNDLQYVSLISDGDADFSNTWNTAWGGYWEGGFSFSNLTDSVTSGSGNLYSAKAAKGALGSDNYAIVQHGSAIKLTGSSANSVVNGVYMTNSTFAFNSMRDGDMFAKKFGGTSGDDPDWLKLTIRGYNAGVLNPDTVAFYLADFQDSDNSKDYILDTWNWVDLSSLGMVDSVTFSMTSSDMGSFGMNTPAFFAMDHFNSMITSVKENVVSNVMVYPNPAVNEIRIQTSVTGNVEIIDLKGAVQYRREGVSNQSVLDISTLNTGVYVVRFVASGTVTTQRLIVQ